MGTDTVHCCRWTARLQRNNLSPPSVLKDLGSSWRRKYYGKVVVRVCTRIARNEANQNCGKDRGDGARTRLNKMSSTETSESTHKTTKCQKVKSQNSAIWRNPTARHWKSQNFSVINNQNTYFNPLNAELNPICHLLALVGVRHILHVSGVRVNYFVWNKKSCCL